MPLSRDEVLNVARLARVGLDPDEAEALTGQLERILDYFDILNEVDVSAVPPTAQVVELANVMRDDEPWESLPVDEVLANAPRSEDGYFRIKAVLE